MKITIISACRNEIKHIRQFLDSVISQDMNGLEWEAVVADGMSEDGTREVVQEYSSQYPQIRFINNPGRIVSAGLNAAIRAATGQVILRMDAHTLYAPNYCRACVETLERTGADNVGGPARTRAAGIRARAIAAAYHSPFSTGGAKFHDEDYEGWVDTVTYGCWKKETLERIGMFDEDLVRNQDDELNLRLTRSGGKVWQSPAIVSWYSPRPTLASLFRQYFQYGFWKVAVIRKHRLPGAWRHLAPLAFVLVNIFLTANVVIAGTIGSTRWLVASGTLGLGIVMAYVLATIIASVIAAKRHGLGIFLYLPLVFATFHFSWALGFLAGLRFYFVKSAPNAYGASVFTQITR